MYGVKDTSGWKGLVWKMEKQMGLFSNQELKKMVVPLFLEQLLVMLVGLADTLVISYAGEDAVSGVSLASWIAEETREELFIRGINPYPEDFLANDRNLFHQGIRKIIYSRLGGYQ